MKQYPSIFNDVIGPVMIGPSSSHTAAAVRIGNVIRQLGGGSPPKQIGLLFDTQSSLATTYNSQGSDIGLLAGLLGFEPDDKRIPDAYKYADEAGINYSFDVKEIGRGHPNAYNIDFSSRDGKRFILGALSVGGGMIEIINYKGFEVSIDGGFFETLIICDNSESAPIVQKLNEALSNGTQPDGTSADKYIINVLEKNRRTLINVKSEEELSFNFPNADIVNLKPIMPVASQITPCVPFVTASEINSYAENNMKSGAGLPLWELAVLYESKRSGLEADAVMGKMKSIVETLSQSLAAPGNNEIKERILPNQSHLIDANNDILGGSFNKNIIKYVTRFMDIKTSMGVFVAAPTAGSCGCLSGTVFALAEELRLGDEDIARALLSAGLVGVIIAHKSTFAAELCGCQAECGAGSAMCAAACAAISGGPAKTCLSAASMALQNVLGLVCDPVGNKVEVPCLGKNILAAFNAVASANMASAGYAELIPLDETIAAMDSVGRALPRELKCTGLGGLSITKTGQKILKGV
jgi:L-serine dehydratase